MLDSEEGLCETWAFVRSSAYRTREFSLLQILQPWVARLYRKDFLVWGRRRGGMAALWILVLFVVGGRNVDRGVDWAISNHLHYFSPYPLSSPVLFPFPLPSSASPIEFPSCISFHQSSPYTLHQAELIYLSPLSLSISYTLPFHPTSSCSHCRGIT